MAVLFLNRADLAELLTLELAIEAVEEAFRAHAQGTARLFPVVREGLAEHDCVYGIKSGDLAGRPALGLKVAGFWPANAARGLAAHQALVVITDPDSGVPLAIMDGNPITTIRTAAAGALAARLLARPDSRVAAIVGSGVQARAQARALLHVLPALERIVVWDRAAEKRREFVAALAAERAEVTEAPTVEAALREADVVVTATPARAPLVQAAWVRPGMHIAALGADTRGKQELDTAILRRATVVPDDLGQSRTLGELQHLAADEDPAALIHAELGQVLIGARPGRQRPDEVTVFDSTGLALQDLTTGHLAYRLAREAGRGQWLELG